MKDHRIVFITGASSGIGRACAYRFAQEGFAILACARRTERLDSLQQEITSRYQAPFYGFPLDVREASQVQKAIRSLPTDWQNIEILINNAGLAAGLDLFQDAQLEDWDQMIDTNLKGLLYVTHEILPLMLSRDRGHIFNLCSIAGNEVYAKGNVYCATKHAIKAISQSLRCDLLGTPIRVSNISPGAVETEFSQVRFKQNHARAKTVYQGMRPLTPEHVADAIYYCASLPPEVTISELTIYPTDQASVTQVYRRSEEKS